MKVDPAPIEAMADRFRSAATTEEAILEELIRLQKGLQRLRREFVDERVEPRDPQFLSLSREVLAHKRTLLRGDRLWILWQAARNVAGLNGAAAEIGCFQGGSAFFIASAFRLLQDGEEAAMEVVDTFQGHPPDQLSHLDGEPHHRPEIFKNTSYESVGAYLARFGRLTVHQGEFSSVAPRLPEQRYRFAHLDVDLHAATLQCLRYFGPRLVPGGVMVVDDYGSDTAEGVEQAVAEYLDGAAGFQSWHPHTKQLLLVKRDAAG